MDWIDIDAEAYLCDGLGAGLAEVNARDVLAACGWTKARLSSASVRRDEALAVVAGTLFRLAWLPLPREPESWAPRKYRRPPGGRMSALQRQSLPQAVRASIDAAVAQLVSARHPVVHVHQITRQAGLSRVERGADIKAACDAALRRAGYHLAKVGRSTAWLCPNGVGAQALARAGWCIGMVSGQIAWQIPAKRRPGFGPSASKLFTPLPGHRAGARISNHPAWGPGGSQLPDVANGGALTVL